MCPNPVPLFGLRAIDTSHEQDSVRLMEGRILSMRSSLDVPAPRTTHCGFSSPCRATDHLHAKMGTVTVAMKRPPLTFLTGAVLLLALSGCAAEPAPAETTPAAAPETTATEPEIQVGDTLNPDQAADLNAGTDLMKAYAVGGTFIAVQWGQPIPETVKAEVGVQVNVGVGPEHGKATQNIAAQQNALRTSSMVSLASSEVSPLPRCNVC